MTNTRGKGGDKAETTPILREYLQIKEAHPDAMVMVRLGDFFELFGDDAELAAPVLGVTLTGRNFGRSGRMPMCGVPHHAIYAYVKRLLDANCRVALWDQVGEVGNGKLVQRAVTRIFSPGMVVEEELLQAEEISRCAALWRTPDALGVAVLEPSSGEIELEVLPPQTTTVQLDAGLSRYAVRELVLPQSDREWPEAERHYAITRVDPGLFALSRAQQRLRDALGISTLHSLEVERTASAVSAAGAILAYAAAAGLKVGQGSVHLRPTAAAIMHLDGPTQRNLEIVQPLSAKGLSIAQLLDQTLTPMGARALRRRLLEPSCQVATIQRRLDALGALRDNKLRRALQAPLRSIRDLERLVTRCIQGIATGRDLMAIKSALPALPALADLLDGTESALLDAEREHCYVPAAISTELGRYLQEDSSALENGYIKPGADAELDELRQMATAGKTFLNNLEQTEKERTGIRSLKIGYNRVFGYYIEVPQTQLAKVPEEYRRKQSLSGAERFITAVLKDQETAILNAKEGTQRREEELLDRCRHLVTSHAPALLRAATAVAEVDIIQSLAEVSVARGWSMPRIDESRRLVISEGRHPLVEQAIGDLNFIANDTDLAEAHPLTIITGPNMGGKSTYLRQVATIVLLAQIGSYVPAKSAAIGIVDRIFTRIGAQDDVSGGLSTFMVEMAETATILHHATSRSLLILDEIGRGTSTFDGMSIAQAIIEHLHGDPRLGCRTLFATHYHELTRLDTELTGVRNAHTEVLESAGNAIVFTHRVVPGAADKSYGIHVATLAGVPASVLRRAQEILSQMETANTDAPDGTQRQLALELQSGPHPVLQELLQLPLEEMTPMAAINKLADLQAQVTKA